MKENYKPFRILDVVDIESLPYDVKSYFNDWPTCRSRYIPVGKIGTTRIKKEEYCWPEVFKELERLLFSEEQYKALI